MEAWEIRTEQERVEDTITVFYIFCEDEVSEPIYFQHFETDLIKIQTFGNQKSNFTNVMNAIMHGTENDFIKYINNQPTLVNKDIKIWCVYDRDKTDINKRLKNNDSHFSVSIITAQNAGIKVAWSNDAFELWVLLHFEEVLLTNNLAADRQYYYDRLTEILIGQISTNEELIRTTTGNRFTYQRNIKKDKFFKALLTEMTPRIHTAFQRSKSLVSHHNQFRDKALHEKAPCTMVHELVEELIRLGKKKEYLHLIE